MIFMQSGSNLHWNKTRKVNIVLSVKTITNNIHDPLK